MHWISEKIQGLSSKERKQLWLLIGFSVFSAYAFYAAQTWEAMFNTEKLANRKADRIEKRIGEIKPPELEEGVTQQTLDQLQTTLNEQETKLKAFAQPLFPAHDSEAREELKLQITQLANSNRLKLASLQASGFSAGKELSELSGQALRDYFAARPSFHLSMQGYYFNLVAFIDALQTLDYKIYTTQFSIEQPADESGLLNIKLELKL